MDDFEGMNDQERAEFIEAEKADEWHDQKVDREKWSEEIDMMRRLRRQLAHGILMLESGMMKDTTPAEKEEHLKKYGEKAMVIGDFVITPRFK